MSYPKIHNIWHRDPLSHQIQWGEFKRPEFRLLLEQQWEFTEKIDGMNIQVRLEPGKEPVIWGRTEDAQLKADLVERIMGLTDWEEFQIMVSDAQPIVVYGEGFGPGIQKGGIYGTERQFAAFDIRVGNRWLCPSDVAKYCSESHIPQAPLLHVGSLTSGYKRVAEGVQSILAPGHLAEGLVGRLPLTLLDQYGERIIVKLKHVDLLQKEEANG